MNENEKRANDFDCELFRLIEKAMGYSESFSVVPVMRSRWAHIGRTLGGARPAVRAMMNAKQRAETN